MQCTARESVYYHNSNLPFSTRSSRLAQPSSSKVVTQIYGMVKPIMGNKLVLMFILWFTNVHIKVSNFVICHILILSWIQTKRYFRKSECDLMWVEINFQISPLCRRHGKCKFQFTLVTLEMRESGELGWTHSENLSRSNIDPVNVLIYISVLLL